MAATTIDLAYFRRGEVLRAVSAKSSTTDLAYFRRQEVMREIMAVTVATIRQRTLTGVGL